MSVRIDPEGQETAALFGLVDLDGREVLEIGSGAGRLTWRYADRVASATTVEPFAGSFDRAGREMPEDLRDTVHLRHAPFETFASEQGPASFDVVILSWSL
jgi:cyclopropane fatty-acyl-phospholipid synthase-like methyltransferase